MKKKLVACLLVGLVGVANAAWAAPRVGINRSGFYITTVSGIRIHGDVQILVGDGGSSLTRTQGGQESSAGEGRGEGNGGGSWGAGGAGGGALGALGGLASAGQWVTQGREFQARVDHEVYVQRATALFDQAARMQAHAGQVSMQLASEQQLASTVAESALEGATQTHTALSATLESMSDLVRQIQVAFPRPAGEMSPANPISEASLREALGQGFLYNPNDPGELWTGIENILNRSFVPGVGDRSPHKEFYEALFYPEGIVKPGALHLDEPEWLGEVRTAFRGKAITGIKKAILREINRGVVAFVLAQDEETQRLVYEALESTLEAHWLSEDGENLKASQRMGNQAAARVLAGERSFILHDREALIRWASSQKEKSGGLAFLCQQTIEEARAGGYLPSGFDDYLSGQVKASQDQISFWKDEIGNGKAAGTIKLMIDMGIDSLQSVHQFSRGLIDGVYEWTWDTTTGVSSAVQAFMASAASGKLHERLATYTLVFASSSAGAQVELGGRALQGISNGIQHFSDAARDALLNFAVVTQVGTPSEKGRALGRLGSDLVAGALGNELIEPMIQGGAPILKGILGGPGVFGEEILTQASRVPGLQAELNEVRNLAKEGERYGPMNPGRLHTIPVDRALPVSSDGANSVGNTFRSSSYFTERTRNPLRLYRFQEYDVHISSETGYPVQEFLPSFYTTVHPEGGFQTILDGALKSDWGPRRIVVQIEVPAGELIHRGFVAEQTSAGEFLMGGGPQVYIEKVPNKWFVKTWKLKE